MGTLIKRMDVEGGIPFPDASFDYVVNNQVMEHVPDLDAVLFEIHRVLKPSGKVLSLFPDKGVWREGHCGVPFLHWFPKRSRLRIYYAAIFRLLGFGHHKAGKSVFCWSADFCDWLDKWTWYRDRKIIQECYRKYFSTAEDIEVYWLQQRLGQSSKLGSLIPPAIQRLVVRKLAGLVFVVSKPVVPDAVSR